MSAAPTEVEVATWRGQGIFFPSRASSPAAVEECLATLVRSRHAAGTLELDRRPSADLDDQANFHADALHPSEAAAPAI